MGVMSGLIATNAGELGALRELGERDYFEFTLSKSKQAQKAGEVQIRLKKADPKQGRYSIELMADDKTIEKKEKTLNEPVQFYTLSARQPYEIVVYEIQKDRVTGYLSTPKVKLAQARGPKL